MHRLKERLRRLKRKPHDPGNDISTAEDGNNETPAPSIADNSAASLPEHLWDRAYDELKDNETEVSLVQAYERILSRHLRERDPASNGDMDANMIAQGNPGARRAQMNQLVTFGLAKIKRETKIKDGLDKGVQVILSAKDIISSAIQTVPQAALAWAGVCVVLEVRYGRRYPALEFCCPAVKLPWQCC